MYTDTNRPAGPAVDGRGTMAEKKLRSEQVYEELKALIMSMDLRPGEPLAELALCERFGVSRTPVRTALRMLESDGFVDFIPHRGAFVKRMSASDVAEILEIRELLEGYCARKACAVITEETLRRIEENLDAAREKTRAGQYEEAMALSNILHDTVIDLAGNKRIRDYLIGIGKYGGRMKYVPSETRHALERSDAEHRAVLEALKARDGALAEQRMQEHIRSVNKDAIYEYVMQSQETAGE